MRNQKIVEIARTWIGTPWMHNQSTKGVGCDCVGLLIGVAIELGILPVGFRLNYGRDDGPIALISHLSNYLVEKDTIEDGDVLVFKRMGVITHTGIVTQWVTKSLIHSTNLNNIGVVEVSYEPWVKNIERVFRYE